MAVALSIIIPLLALLATFYQLRLQRVHNEKSLKPLGQITLVDHNKVMAVHLYNNGLGPLIIERLTFCKSDNTYSSIKDCLSLSPKSYMYMAMDDLAERVVLPNSHLTIFEKDFGEQANEIDLNVVRAELSAITLQAVCRDIYDNKIVVQRNFKWFSRHLLESVN